MFLLDGYEKRRKGYEGFVKVIKKEKKKREGIWIYPILLKSKIVERKFFIILLMRQFAASLSIFSRSHRNHGSKDKDAWIAGILHVLTDEACSNHGALNELRKSGSSIQTEIPGRKGDREENLNWVRADCWRVKR